MSRAWFWRPMVIAGSLLQFLLSDGLAISATELTGALGKPALRSQAFDRDPGWEAFNNRIVPKNVPTIVQDFGYSQTNFAGRAVGEIGGSVWRASEPAFYAARITPRTLHDKFGASGSFALTRTTASSGAFFGFFRAEQPGGGGRPMSSLGLDFDGEGHGARLAVRLITGKNQSCGTFITPFIPGKFRPTPIRNDGTRYTWKLDYDPAAAGGRGRFIFTLDSDAHRPGELETEDLPADYREEARQRFPSTTKFAVDLPDGFQEQGTRFDHFGLMNIMKAGGPLTVYFDDVSYDGHSEEFAAEPGWDLSRSRATYTATDIGGAHNFGFSNTSNAGGKAGEIGGTFWRGGPFAYYADRVGPLTLDDRLEASGKVVLKVGAPDSDMYLGWFDSARKQRPREEPVSFMGIHVGGPTRVGHYFHPAFAASKGGRGGPDAGPVMEPGRVYPWSFFYDPNAASGQGTIRVALGEESMTFDLPRRAKAEPARFDRFGLFTSTPGGQIVKIFLDDLKYTAGRSMP